MLGNPLARTDKLVVQKSGDEHLIYDLQTNKAICLNQTSALVWEHCDGKHSVSDIAKALEKKLGSEVSEDLVLFAINQLANEGLLLGSEELAERFRGVSRREVIKKVGFASMVALPIISAVVAPKAIYAQSCVGIGMQVTGTVLGSCFNSVAFCENFCSGIALSCCSGIGVISPPGGPCTPSTCLCVCG